MSQDPILVSLGDVVLRSSDVELLQRPKEWFNDSIIAFSAEDSLSRSMRAADVASVLPPSLAFLLACSDGVDLSPVMAPLQLDAKTLVLLPVSNNPDPDRAQGGSHWSLLAYTPSRFLHLDSSRGMNQHAAKQLARAAAPYLAPGRRLTAPTECTVPQQENRRGSLGGVSCVAVSRRR